VSFHTPEDAMVFAGVSVRFVPPTASTHGDVAGHDADFCLSKLVSWEDGTPWAHDDEPLSPAETTIVMPSAAVAAAWRSNSVRAAL
jgi:hypothetical protein